MIVKLLIEHQLEFLSLKGGCRGFPSLHNQNAILLEITCTDLIYQPVDIEIYEDKLGQIRRHDSLQSYSIFLTPPHLLFEILITQK